MGVDDLVLKGIDLNTEAICLALEDGVIGDEVIALVLEGCVFGLKADEGLITGKEDHPGLDADGVADGDDGFDTGALFDGDSGVKEAAEGIDGNAGHFGQRFIRQGSGTGFAGFNKFISPHNGSLSYNIDI